MVVVYDFNLLLNQTSVAINLPPYNDYEEENNIEEMPWLDITRMDCNCNCCPNVSNVAVRTSVVFTASQIRSDSGESTCDSDSNISEHDLSELEPDHPSTAVVEETHYVEYFKLKGSTYHEHFQKALKQSKRSLLNKQEVPIQLVIEPANAKDENAIVVQAELEGMWQPVGYIPAIKVKKAKEALNKTAIRTAKFKGIEWKYIYGLGEFRYVALIVVTKVDKWLPSDKKYQYNIF